MERHVTVLVSDDGIIVAKASGLFDLESAELITRHVDPEHPPKEVRICLNDVTTLKSSGIAALLVATHGFCDVFFRSANEDVATIVNMVGAFAPFTQKMEEEFAALEIAAA